MKLRDAKKILNSLKDPEYKPDPHKLDTAFGVLRHSAWFNTVKGIRGYLTDLTSLSNLFRVRHMVGYSNVIDRRRPSNRLNEFYVLGRYYLDTCGNAMKCEKSYRGKIPDVLSYTAFWDEVTRVEGEERSASITSPGMEILNTGGRRGPSLSFSHGSDVPPAHVLCPHCGKPWNLKTCEDVVDRHSYDTLPLADFEGKTLRVQG